MSEHKILAMYDIRGIQNYIFRTTKVIDAMGGSLTVDDIISSALQNAVEKTGMKEEANLTWYDNNGPLPYEPDGKNINVLFIGGGNAYVMYESVELYRTINRHMARFVLENTYSLQLTVTQVPVTEWYYQDYENLRRAMEQRKADSTASRPYGALPIMKVERLTGYPITKIKNGEECSTETYGKQTRKYEANESELAKLHKNLEEKKGVDSILAVVHIDGNNMGSRIREALQDITDYTTAVNLMRQISYAIKTSYSNVFLQMQNDLEEPLKKQPLYKEKETPCFIRKILIAGDDITYVCTGKIALATVEYFCKQISQYTMTGKTDQTSIREYGFSVCAGVAFVGSHFPFSAAYEVAEACCGEAKSRAKKPENRDGKRIANFVDFQFCRNVQTKNLEKIREQEYMTYYGEQLLRRPYYIKTDADGTGFEKLEKTIYSFADLKQAVRYFRDHDKIPRSHAKALQKAYSLGHTQVEQHQAFLDSRNIIMPDGDNRMYCIGGPEDGQITAKWFDALEVMDCFLTLEEIENPEVVAYENI